MNQSAEKNEYTLLDFKQSYTNEGKLQTSQEIIFYKLNPDGSYENGTTLEEMLRVCFERLTDLNNRFKSDHNIEALKHITAARECLEERTIDRLARDVEGKHEI